MLTVLPGATTSSPFYKARQCLLCGSSDIQLALPLARSAIGNDYLRERSEQMNYALNLHLCVECGNVQIEDVVNPDLLFRQYTYSSTSSLGLVEHFRKYAAEIVASTGARRGALVVDIGSNDGSLLKAFDELGFRVVGVDPAIDIAARATADGVLTIPDYFTPSIASRIREEYGHASIITANNVFAHSDKLPAMAVAIQDLLAQDGVFTFEVSYLLDIVQKMLFDTIYHEHLCYHSVRSLANFFRRHGLQLIDARRISTKGGSLRGTVQLAGGGRPVTPGVRQLIQLEQLFGLHSPETFRAFASRIELAKVQFTQFLDRCRVAGRLVAGYGASPTVTTLLSHFDLASRIDFLVDDNSVKQHTFSPGQQIPVYPPDAIYEREVDVIAVLAWNYATPIIAKHTRFSAEGGRFVVPLPQLQVF